jgi:hypothetical protein
MVGFLSNARDLLYKYTVYEDAVFANPYPFLDWAAVHCLVPPAIDLTEKCRGNNSCKG